MKFSVPVILTLVGQSLIGPGPFPWTGSSLAHAQEADGQPPVLRVSLSEALEVALVRSYVLNRARVDIEDADAQVTLAYSDVYPRLEGTASYTRIFDTINPFAGSTVGGSAFLGGPDPGEFLLNNERLTDLGEPELQFSDFAVQQLTAQNAAGRDIELDDNPFFVANQFRAGLTITQILYDGGAFAAIKGVGRFRRAQRESFRDVARQTIQQVSQLYFQALLAKENADILLRSEERTRVEVVEMTQRVEQGTRPQFDLLSTQVRLANAEAARIRAENEAENALDRLRLAMGLPAVQKIVPSDELTAPDPKEAGMVAENEAMATAFQLRPDLEAARLVVEVNRIEENVTFADYTPRVDLFFTVGVIGQVPDDRTQVVATDPVLPPVGDEPITGDPFAFDSQTPGFFSGSYWGPDVQGGIRLNWTIFNGFDTTARLRRNRLATAKSELQYQELRNTIQVEVVSSIRSLRSAAEQLRSQNQNIERAELNYEQAAIRVSEGVAGSIVLREASQQLDDSRLNYRQAIHDYRIAEVTYQVAVGQPPFITLSEVATERSDDQE